MDLFLKRKEREETTHFSTHTLDYTLKTNAMWEAIYESLVWIRTRNGILTLFASMGGVVVTYIWWAYCRQQGLEIGPAVPARTYIAPAFRVCPSTLELGISIATPNLLVNLCLSGSDGRYRCRFLTVWITSGSESKHVEACDSFAYPCRFS